jgi:hypothetical protein
MDKISVIIRKSIISIVMILALSASPSSVEGLKASNSDAATNTRLSIQSADVIIDEGDRYLGLIVTRDVIANTTSLNFGYRFLDPNDSNQTIYIIGDEGEIPNSTFTINSTSAQLRVTTPDSYAVTRCVVNNDTGDYTCAPSGPSTFNLTWIEDGSLALEGNVTRFETSESWMVRTRGRFEQVNANVSGMWDEHSSANMTGFLTNSENATLFREKKLESDLLFFRLLALQSPQEITLTLLDKERADVREAFAILYDENGNLNGFVNAWQDGIINNTMLVVGYAYTDPNDPSRVLSYRGFGEIPNSAFTINSNSAQLKVTTPDSFTLVYCVITGVIGPDPGAVTCSPIPAPVTLDITWTTDGNGRVHESSWNILTEGSLITKFHREYNRFNAPASGTWNDVYEHAGTNMFGSITRFQNVVLTNENP